MSKMEVSAKIVGCIQPSTIFAKHFILGVSQCYEHASDKTKQNPGALSAICTSNHMFKRKIWDKFTEFTFLKF